MVFKLFREKVQHLSNNVSVQNITMEQVAKSVRQDIIKMLMENVLNVHVMARKYTKWPELTFDDPWWPQILDHANMLKVVKSNASAQIIFLDYPVKIAIMEKLKMNLVNVLILNPNPNHHEPRKQRK